MGVTKSVGNFISKVSRSISKDDYNNLTKAEKMQIEETLRERRLELIAEKKMRELEARYNPKKGSGFSGTLNQLKEYRQRNLARHDMNVAKSNQRVKNWEKKQQQINPNFKVKPLVTEKSVGDKVREDSRLRREKMLRISRGY